MLRGPKGERRPADVIGNAVRVARIATGEEADDIVDPAAKGAGSEGRQKARREPEPGTARRNCPQSGRETLETKTLEIVEVVALALLWLGLFVRLL